MVKRRKVGSLVNRQDEPASENTADSADSASNPKKSDWFGMDAGRAWIADDFDELPEDILELMADPKIFPDEDEDELTSLKD
ncbi:MAG TPA: hypothetical protein PKC65_13645 [Pyrinomonadaceae bacterium]|mgnify:CR=1 FL=1|nr:hypothetical protein [Pyrinomonadaceae bacterium]